jgi:SNF2 family DNA or RNA helicase
VERPAVTRTYGSVKLKGDIWMIEAEPHIVLKIKRIFERVSKGEHGTVTITDTDEVRRDLLWFLDRYALKCPDQYLAALRQGAERHKENILTLERIVDLGYKPRDFSLALPPREYQRRAAEVVLKKRGLLLADDVGVGKTVSAICMLTEPCALPATVVCPSGRMPIQWQEELARFAPTLFTHVVKKGTLYELPRRDGKGPDVVILNYHKLQGWAQVLARYSKTAIFDEAQELRRSESLKWAAAMHLAEHTTYRLGLSATPIYNYGGELFNVLEVLSPGALGTETEFRREWCEGAGRHVYLRDARAFGTYLREQFLMLRRTRRDVGREIPELARVPQTVGSDPAVFEGIRDQATELARIILSDQPLEKGLVMEASREFANALRQATGVAKAPYVAAFIRMLAASDEGCVVFGWHRAVYDILLKSLEDLRPAMFTGSESPSQKAAEFKRFTDRDTRVMLMSLRAASGLDGLQKVCRTAVFAELDWSPGVMEQCIGRIHRDGQPDPVVAYFLVAEDGADPTMAEVLGLKRDQVEGIRNPHGELIETLETDKDRIRALARAYLKGGRRRPALAGTK